MKKIIAIFLGFSCLVFSAAPGTKIGAAAQSAPIQNAAPPMPFVDHGACPFEGCVYGDWTALRSVVAVDDPSGTWMSDQPASTLKHLFSLRPGELVTATTGLVAVTAPGRAIAKAGRQFRLENPVFPKLSGGLIDVAAGDTVYLLSYQGEGVHTAWVKGQLTSFREGDDGSIVERAKSVWWIRLRNSRGQVGWATTEGYIFDGSDRLSGPQESHEAFYNQLGAMQWTDLRPGIRIKPIVGETGTFVLAEFDPQSSMPDGHRHTQEQGNFGLTGDLRNIIAGHEQKLGPRAATLTHPDAEHIVVNRGTAVAQMLEFQPVRRLDLLPPRLPPTYSIGPKATTLTAGQVRAADFSTTAGWTSDASGVRRKTLSGATMGFTLIEVPATAEAPINLRPSPVPSEQFFYVLEGRARLTVGKDVREIYPNTVVLVPKRVSIVTIRPTNNAGAKILRFDPFKSTRTLPSAPPSAPARRSHPLIQASSRRSSCP